MPTTFLKLSGRQSALLGARRLLRLTLLTFLIAPLSRIQAQDEGSAAAPTQTPDCVIRKTACGWETQTMDGVFQGTQDPRKTWEAKYQSELHYAGAVLVQLDDSTWMPFTMVQTASQYARASAFITSFGIITGDEQAYDRYTTLKAQIEHARRYASEVQQPPRARPSQRNEGQNDDFLQNLGWAGFAMRRNLPLDAQVVDEYRRMGEQNAQPTWVHTASNATISVSNPLP